MRQGRPSQTAALVAFLRALGDAGLTRVTGFADPTARAFLPPRWRRSLDRLQARPEARDAWRERLARGAVDLLALRTLAIDQELAEAVEAGARQVVILGAGLDGRAYRMPELSGCRVIEVDHPDTQAPKRARAEALTPTAAEVVFAPVVFGRDRLDEALAGAGHRPEQPTAWVWEGVVMYLDDRAFASTLAAVAVVSAPGSRLIVQYNTGEGWDVAGALVTRLWGEPQIGQRSAGETGAALVSAGFAVLRDRGTADWARARGVPPLRAVSARRCRLILGERRPGGPTPAS